MDWLQLTLRIEPELASRLHHLHIEIRTGSDTPPYSSWTGVLEAIVISVVLL